MSPLIELIYDFGCPHVDEARKEIAAALKEEGLPQRWEESRRPAFGSPTVVVDGRDVASGASARSGDGSFCRIYPEGDVMRGAPSRESIRKALREASKN